MKLYRSTQKPKAKKYYLIFLLMIPYFKVNTYSRKYPGFVHPQNGWEGVGSGNIDMLTHIAMHFKSGSYQQLNLNSNQPT